MRGLTARLLIFNLLLAVFPIGAFLFLGTYEEQLLISQERAMVQQGRLLASALAGENLEVEARTILQRLGSRTDSRLRVVDEEGRLVADSARPSPEDVAAPPTTARQQAEAAPESARNNVLYQIGALPTRTLRGILDFFSPPEASSSTVEFYAGKLFYDGPEIIAALGGRYGAATRITKGQTSVTLYSAIPVYRDRAIVGAVLVSRSTIGILTDLYRLRLDIVRIFFVSVAFAVILSVLLARTVTVPVGRLRKEAETLLDERGKLQAPFRPMSGKDEVADLSRALHRLSSQLKQRSVRMEEFMADLVHEMKNPVAGILSAAELAEGAPPEETGRFLNTINREGRRIQRLLDDLRELISVDVHLEKGSNDPIDPVDFLKTLAETYIIPPERQVHLEFQSTESVEADLRMDIHPDRLAQAVFNLLDNAVSFSPSGTNVELVLSFEEPWILISVKDRGPGLRGSDKVFERWYTDRPESEASSHTGLGLAIVKGIAEGYGGSVHGTERENGGTVMTLRLPQA